MKYVVARDLTPEEFVWLPKVIKAGTVVLETDDVWGCCSADGSGMACIIPGVKGYCELPVSALKMFGDKSLN